jgi:hypothetical protein
MINKQVHNTGSSGGHGMTTVDTVAELKKEESRLVKEHSGHTVVCTHMKTMGDGLRVSCGETFLLNQSDYSAEECLALSASLREKGCPYCTGQRDNYAHDSVELERLSVGTKIFVTVRKPMAWKRQRKIPTMAEVMKRHNRNMRNYVR